VLVRELTGTLVTIAKDVKIQIEFNPAVATAWRLIGYENRVLAAQDFNDDKKDAGEIGAGHSVTALYEITLADRHGARSEKSLKYSDVKVRDGARRSSELLTVSFRYKPPAESESRLLSEVVKDRDTGRSRGFGFVVMTDRKDASKAIDKLNGAELDGRNIVVNVATERSR